MQPPTPPTPPTPEQPQPPAWTQYDNQPLSPPVVQPQQTSQPDWLTRVWKAIAADSKKEVARWAHAFNLPVPWFFGLVGVSVLLVCSFCGMLNAVISQANQSQQQAYAAAATQTADAPTVTPAPTATIGPTPLPTATPTPLQQLQQIVQRVATSSYTFDITYSDGVAVVNETIGANDVVSAIICKQEIFNVQQAIWRQWSAHPHEVDVNIIGPLQDKYGNVTNGPYAHSMILSSSASQFNWANLDADSAWNAYDEAFIRSDV